MRIVGCIVNLASEAAVVDGISLKDWSLYNERVRVNRLVNIHQDILNSLVLLDMFQELSHIDAILLVVCLKCRHGT